MRFESEQLQLVQNIPSDEVEEKRKTNIISFILKEILEERDLNLSLVSTQTGISYNTLHEWLSGNRTPMADENLLTLSKYLNLSITYLCYGIGSDEPAYLDEKGNPKKFKREA